jgi:cytochrome c-type biogenesis protein CcsB
MKKLLSVCTVAAILFQSVVFADEPAEKAAGEMRKGWNFSNARLIPVQSNGRIKPLDTYTREMVLFMTGSRSFQGWSATEFVFSLIGHPRVWTEKEFIQVNREDVRKQLGLDATRSRFSPGELLHKSYLSQYVQTVQDMSKVPANKLPPRDQELKRVMERVGLFRTIVSGDAWPVIPVKPPEPWMSLSSGDKENAEIRSHFAKMLLAYRSGDQAQFESSAQLAREAVQQAYVKWIPDHSTELKLEDSYNRMHPFMISWIFYLTAALLWLLMVTGATENKGALKKMAGWIKGGAYLFTFVGVLVHVYGFALRCYVAGRPPVSNMYESVIWVSLGVMIFGLILFFMDKKEKRQPILPAVACSVATLALIAADSAPAIMDPSINPLVPVLKSNYWLTVHVLTITLGYAAFALTMGLGNVSLFQYLKKDTGMGSSSDLTARVTALNQLTYRAMQFGVVLLAAGTILGGIWADESWGRFWGWDPKEVWALIALLFYLAVLHARYAGWFKQFGFAMWSVLSFLGVLMSWYGVNFVLPKGKHSYGFSSGGRGWVVFFVSLQIAYVLISAYYRYGGIQGILKKAKA